MAERVFLLPCHIPFLFRLRTQSFADIGVLEFQFFRYFFAFTFWIGVAMGNHLEEVGKGEAERILSYHARGIARQVEELVRDQFTEMWPTYGPEEDFIGLFMAPGDQWDSPPVEIAKWNADRLFWAP